MITDKCHGSSGLKLENKRTANFHGTIKPSPETTPIRQAHATMYISTCLSDVSTDSKASVHII